MLLSGLACMTGLILSTTSGQQPLNCHCGQKKEESQLGHRVVGGGDAFTSEFPWTAHITIRSGRRKSRCGGSLINDRFVVTAAHCVEETNLTINVTLGEHDITIKEGIEFRTRVKEFGFEIHNSYSYQSSEGTNEYDIALLELEKPNIRTNVTTGRIDQNSAANVLQKLTDIQILGQSECDAVLARYEDVTGRKAKLRRSNICGRSDSGDSCSGDSGSGLVAWNQDRRAYELIGVVSFGVVGCDSSIHGTKLPGVYTRVSETVGWIRGKSDGGLSCGERTGDPGYGIPSPVSPPPVGWSLWSDFTPCQALSYPYTIL